MSEKPLAKLRFISWASRGAIRLIHEEGNKVQTKPGQFDVEFDVLNKDKKVNKTVKIPAQLYGPEKITGIDHRQVIRTFPPHLSSDNESNYFACLEFDSSFLGWVASLKQAQAIKDDGTPTSNVKLEERSILEPSFVLAVVPKDKEGIKLTIDPESKLQILEFDGVNASEELPKIDEAYYWTHIQTLTTTDEESKDFTDDDSYSERDGMIENTLKKDDINTICRIISPRRLKPGTSYYGCLLSIYKATNKIIDPNISVSDTNKLEYAWDDGTEAGKFLVFYSFEFTTDPEPGDFETLVRRLKPRTLPPKVGTRFMAVPSLSSNYPCYGQTTSSLPPPEEALQQDENYNDSSKILLVGQKVSLNNEIIKNTINVQLKKIASEEDTEEGLLTLQIIKPPGKPDVVEDFEEDDFWESNDASIAVNISENTLTFDVRQDDTNDACSYVFDEAASNNKWILRFQLEITNASNDSRLLVGLSDNDFNLGADVAQNFLGMQLTQTSSINGILPIFTENFPPQQQESQVEYDNFALSSGQIFYLEVSRFSSTSFVIRRYADPNYSQVIESLERSCPGSLQNLKFIKLMNFVKNETGTLRGKIKLLRFWNNLNEINPEGEIIAESESVAVADIPSSIPPKFIDCDKFDLGDIKYPPIHGDVIVAIKKSEPLGTQIQIARYDNKDIRGIATRFEDGEWKDYSNNFDHGFEISYSLEGLGLEGALRSPLTESTNWPDTEGLRYQNRLKKILNENDKLLSIFSNLEPKVLPPLYGSRQAAKTKIPDYHDHSWFPALNLDPRNRAIAGLGMLVVNDQQEQLREAAWQMIEEIENINQTLRQGQLSRSVSFGLNQWIKNLSLDSFMMVTNPVHAKILDNGDKNTMQNKIKSKLGNGILSPTFRKIVNPTGPIGKKIFGDSSLVAHDSDNLTFQTNINPKFSLVSSEYKGMGGMISVLDLPRFIDKNAPDGASDIIKNLIAALIPDRDSDFDDTSIGKIDCDKISSNEIPFEIPPDSELVGLPDVSVSGTGVSVSGTGDPVSGITTSNLIVNLCNSAKTHQKEIHKQLVKTRPPLSSPTLDLEEIRKTIEAKLDPEYTIQRRILNRIDIGDTKWNSEDPLEQMTACIEFPQPMGELLSNISQDLLIPGIEHTPQNTITLLEENPSFIESYLVGLNNAFSSEALWHKIPVSLTCSFFRQFWNKNTYPLPDEKELKLEVINDLGIDPNNQELIEHHVKQRVAQEIENRKDIDHIHKWLHKPLGENYKRLETPQVVLLIRGDLLRKYSNSVIYAIKGEFDYKNKPKFPSQTDNLDFPKFRGFLKPDITFFGFDLTKEEVMGGPNNPGYFFVIQEQPSDLSFKLDESDRVNPNAERIRDLSWKDFEDGEEFNYLSIKDTKNVVELHQTLPAEEKNKWNSHSAQVANNLLKRPIRVAIHARQMLEGV